MKKKIVAPYLHITVKDNDFTSYYKVLGNTIKQAFNLVDNYPTAKKDYKCENCGVKIAANTKYMDFATKYMRTRLCVECGKAVTGEE